jgi:predicted KAP-like P-loop ATPase
MFDSGAPITAASEDLLGRRPFAAALAHAILAQREHSITMGLYGGWGSGKTSIINMALQFLKEQSWAIPSEHRPIVVRFEPWHFSGQDQLISQFFNAIAVGLRNWRTNRILRRVERAAARWSKAFKAHPTNACFVS